MECTMINNSGSGIFKLFVIVVFFFAVIVVTVSVMPNSHAVARHGVEAVMTHSCINDGGTIRGTMTRQDDGHKATICEISGMFYIYIEDSCGSEITSMCKNKMSRLDQVTNYLNNRGYK